MKRTGFTVIELIVVVSIIATLAALLFPALYWARQTAYTDSTLSDMQSISMALSAYHSVFHVYPDSRQCANLNGEYPDGATWAIPPSRADVLLAEALIGFLPARLDGSDAGFTMKPYKQVYGPYVSSTTGIAKVANPNDPSVNLVDFIDSRGHPIYYFSANTSANSGYVFDSPHQNGVDAQGKPIMVSGIFDSEDNQLPFPDYTQTMPIPTQTFLKYIGDRSGTNTLTSPRDLGDQIMGSRSFLLVGKGSSQQYFGSDNVVLSGP